MSCGRCVNGVLSTYWGEVFHPMYGRIKVDGEHRWPLHDCPGGTFYGGSGHQRCPCLGPVSGPIKEPTE